jgi:inner membrane protein
MDIVTQGIIGALAAQALAKPEHSRRATLIGFVAGLPADADIIIRSSTDPLLTLEFHRQFTHALLFIPAGGLIVAGLLWLLLKKKIPFAQIFLFALAGYATSGLLDACTSYGTQLLWPFSTERFAWSIIAVVDPIFSLTMILCLTLGWRRPTPNFAQMGWLFVAGYLIFGLSQQNQAASLVQTLAAKRGHEIERMVVKPTMGNLLVWRTVYKSKERYHITAVRVSPFASPLYSAGESLPVFNPETALSQWQKNSTLVNDVYRFNHFSDGYIAQHPNHPEIIGDIRYSLLPFGTTPIWGITLNRDQPNLHVPFKNYRAKTSEAMKVFPKLLTGSWEKWLPMSP